MKKQDYIIIALAICVAALAYFLFDLNGRYSKLSESNNIINKGLEVEKTRLVKENDDLLKLSEGLMDDIKTINKSLDDLETKLSNINKKSHGKKSVIRRITDVDSLQRLVSDRYKRR